MHKYLMVGIETGVGVGLKINILPTTFRDTLTYAILFYVS